MKARPWLMPVALVVSLLVGSTLACGKGRKETPQPTADTGQVVQVPAALKEPTIVSFLADDPLVPAGGCTFLRWQVQGADAVYVNRHLVEDATQEICPAKTTAYLLAASNKTGTSRARVVVEVGEAPAAGPLPEILSFDPDEPTVAPGACTILRWDVRGATAVTVDGGAASGTNVQVCPAVTTTFTLVAESAAGPVSATTTVVVGKEAAGSQAPWIVSFDSDEPRVAPGECTILRWDVRNATSLMLDGQPVPGTSFEVCLSATTAYRLDASNGVVKVSALATVEVGEEAAAAAPLPEIVSFDADEPAITLGQCTWLRWDVRGAAEVQINRRPVSGTSFEVCPKASAGYTLTALNEANQARDASTRVTVNDASGLELADTIANLTVTAEGVRSVDVAVDYRYISSAEHGETVDLVAAPLYSKAALAGFAAEPQTIAAGSGRATFRLLYTGAGTPTSDQIVVYMVEPAAEMPFAFGFFDLDKTWTARGQDNPDSLQATGWTSTTPGEIEIEVAYEYNSDHGQGARIGGQILGLAAGFDASLFRLYPSDVLQPGSHTTTLRGIYTGARPTQTTALRLYMWEPEAPRFYVDSFDLAIDWSFRMRDLIVLDQVDRLSGREVALRLRYDYVSDHGIGVGIRVKLFDGETPLDDFVCVDCPTALAPAERIIETTIVVRYVGPGTSKANRIRLSFWEPEVPDFFATDAVRDLRFGGALTVEGEVQPYADGGTDNCNNPDYSQPWPVTLVETYPYDPPRTWTVHFSTRSDCDGARAGEIREWTGLVSRDRADVVEQCVPGGEWHKSLVGTVTFRNPADRSVDLITPTYWEPAVEANQAFTVFFAEAADFDRVGVNDFISVDGRPGGQWLLREATLDWTSPPRRRALEPLPSADSSLTEPTRFDLIAQVSRELLQSVLSDTFDPIRVPFTAPNGNRGTLILEEPSIDLNGPHETAALLLVPVHSQNNNVQFTLTLGATFLMSGMSSELQVLFSQPAVHSVRYQGNVHRQQELPPLIQAAVEAAGAALSQHPISLPMDYVDDLIEDIPFTHGVRPLMTQWVPLVVPTAADGDGWVFLGADVSFPTTSDWWTDVTIGQWNYVYDLTGGRQGDGAAFAVSDDLMNGLIAFTLPEVPYAITFDELGLDPIRGSYHDWLGVDGYAAQYEVASWNIRMIIVDELQLEYGGGILRAPFTLLDFYAIDCAEIGCYDNSDKNDVPSKEHPGEPGNRAYSHGVEMYGMEGSLGLTLGGEGPGLGLQLTDRGIWLDRADFDIVLEAGEAIDDFLDSYMTSVPPSLLDLRFELPGSLGWLEATLLEPRPQDTIIAFSVVP